jgi:DNA-binding cell septation regulator SpoVG
MRNFIDTAEDFESWILQSRKHKFIADLSWDEFFRLQKIPMSHADDSLRMVAMLESTMMNWGFSIENAIKGVLVAKEPKIVTNGQIKKIVWGINRGTGHEISQMVQFHYPDLYPEVKDLLERAETFVIWAGRYPTPLKEDWFRKAISSQRLAMKIADKESFESLRLTLEEKAYSFGRVTKTQ